MDSGASGSAGSTKATPVDHPDGLSYGTWLRSDSHLLDAGDTKAVLVEFLDFECEACGSVFPVIEQLRAEFAGRLTYGIRYFPLTGHPNSRPAAYAVEAAARQGKLQQMYHQMYANQSSWAMQSSVDGAFRQYARAAGVDVDTWETARGSAAVSTRVDTDLADAEALNLAGTPSFYFNGKRLQPKSIDDLRSTIEDALT